VWNLLHIQFLQKPPCAPSAAPLHREIVELRAAKESIIKKRDKRRPFEKLLPNEGSQEG
jgi:hypothetical protein